jgi:hypothetical protein
MPNQTIKILVEQVAKPSDAAKKIVKDIETETKNSNKRIVDSEKSKSKEVLAVEAQTAKQKKENQHALESSLRNRIQAELKLEKDLAKSKKQIANDFLKEFHKQQAQVSNSGFSKDLFQGTFLGSLLGSSTGGAINQVISGIISAVGSLISIGKDLGLRILQVGADFEKTVNAMRVFAGSTNLAKKELADISDLAQNTRGLRLEDAEAGATRLRGLNFDLALTKDLIVGISKEKLINNSDEAEINRVITNLAQLKAGSPQARRDIQQMVLAMPHLSLVIKDTFGSIEKFQQAIQKDSVGALRKFAEGMKNVEAPAEGLQGSVGKFFDELIKGSRALSSPIIPEITRDIKSLTDAIRDNNSELGTWASAGQKIANIYKTISQFIRDWRGNNRNLEKDLGVKQDDIFAPPGLSQKELDQTERRFRDFVKKFPALQKYFSPNTAAEQLKNAQASLKDPSNVLNNLALDPDKFAQKQAAELQAERALIDRQERDRQDQLAKIDSFYKQTQSIRESALSLEIAQNQTNAQKVFEINQLDYQRQIAEAREFYDNKIALQDGDAKEIYKLEIEKNNAIRELNAKRQIEQINFEREQNEKRRQGLLAAKNLQLREINALYDNQIFALEKNIERGIAATSQGYGELIEITKRQENVLSETIRSEYALRLQDKTLTNQQIINLEKERDLEIQALAEQTSRKILEIDERRYNQMTERLKAENNKVSRFLQERGQLFSQIQNAFLKPSLSFGAGFKEFGLGILDTGTEISVGEKINAVLSNRLSIYEAQKYALEETHKTEQKSLEREIELNKALIGLEYSRLNQQISQALRALEAKKNAAQTDEEKAGYQKEIDRLNLISTKNLDEQSPAIQNYKRNIDEASDALTRLKLNQAGDKQNLFEQSTEGLKAFYAAIQSGQKDNLVKQLSENNLWKQRIDLATEIKFLQAEINGENNDSLKIQAAHLRDILDLRNRELDAVISINRSQLELNHSLDISNNQIRARVYEHLASQKTLNESIADGIIGTYEAVAKKLEEPLDKLNEKTKGFLSFLIEPAKAIQRNLLTSATRGIVDKIFPGMGSELTKTNNPIARPIVDKLDEIKQVLMGTRGAGSILSTINPGFNPNGSIFGNPFAIPNITGGVGVPLGGGTTDKHGGIDISSSGQGGLGSILGKGGLFGSKGFGFNAGTGAGLGTIGQVAGGMIGGKWGNLLSMAGTGAQIGSMFGPWGAAIGAGIGAGIGLLGFLGASMEKKLKKAVKNAYGIDVSDDVIKQLKIIAKSMPGASAEEVVRTPMARELILDSTTNATAIEKLDPNRAYDPLHASNIYNSSSPSLSQVVRSTFSSSGTVGSTSISVPSIAGNRGVVDTVILAQLTDAIQSFNDKFGVASSTDVVMAGASGASREIAAATQKENVNNPWNVDAQMRNTGLAN